MPAFSPRERELALPVMLLVPFLFFAGVAFAYFLALPKSISFLYDLRGGGRRRTVQIVYIALAVLMGAGLVLFGIGGAVSGGLVDAITNGGSGTATTNAGTYQKREAQAVAATKAKPKDPAVWASLARARFLLANAGDNYNQSTGV